MIESHGHGSHSKYKMPSVWFMRGKFQILNENRNLTNWVQHEEVSRR
jgi:hypothetical protein